VPLLDLDGSTIGLVNAAQVDSGPVTTYTYDPSGNPTATGTPNDWPFQYQGMEKEFTDPAPYYYSGSGQFYSPQLVRSLSETGQTSSSGNNGGPSGSAIAGPSGSSGSGFNPVSASNIETSAENEGGGAAAGALAGLYIGTSAGVSEGPVGALVGAVVGATIGAIASFFEEIFGGGGSSPQIPRQLRHGRHPLYPVMLGVQDGLIPTMDSAGKPPICGDPFICPTRPLPKKDPAPSPTPTQNGNLWGTFSPQDLVCSAGPLADLMSSDPCREGCCIQHDTKDILLGCNYSSWFNPDSGTPCGEANSALVTCLGGCFSGL
jgi:hypothetical protein